MSSPQHALYLPRLLLSWLTEAPGERARTFEGSVIFADVSGFTALTEALAKEHGKGGSERINRIMNDAFTELVEILFAEGGDLLRYGGDALFGFFQGEDHAGRAARAAIDMRDEIGEIDAGPVQLGISIGLASGVMDVVIVGQTEREMFFSGSAVDEAMAAETAASTGQVFVPHAFRDLLPNAAYEESDGYLELTADDPDTPFSDGAPDVQLPEDQDYSSFISLDLRERLTLALVGGEHRPASIGFVMFHEPEGLDEKDRHEALESLFAEVRAACVEHKVAYLGNDVYPAGGKFLIADGVPQRSSGSEGVAAALYRISQWEGALDLHSGCARGYVFAGDLGAPNRRAYTVIADTANLAARLAASAADGEVLVTEAALERSRGEFTTERGPALELKGKSIPVSPFRILEVAAELETEAHIELFGRDQELAALRQFLARSTEGKGGLALLTAPEGMGKGLLADEATEGFDAVVAVRCGTELARGVGFTGRLLEQIVVSDSDGDLAEAVELAALDSARTTKEDIELMQRALGIEIEEDGPEEATEQLGVRIARAVCDLVDDLSTESRVFRFENVDEANASAKAVIAELAARARDKSWGVLALADEPIGWLQADAAISLEPFDEDTAHGFVRYLLGDEVLPAHQIEQILARGNGNPYVIQELTSSALAGGEVPESIEAAAVAKMDRLDPRDEQLLCLTAVLGTEARIELLTAVLPDPALAEDASSWARLHEFVDTSTVGKIRFREPVVRDAAYGMLPMKRRQEAHARVAATIEQRARRRPERYAGELAFHFHKANDLEKSWQYSQIAADTALRRLDLFAAVTNRRQAIEAGTALGLESADLAAAQEGLGDACEAAGLFADAVEAFVAADQLQDHPADSARLTYKNGLAQIRLGHSEEARAMLDSAIELAEANDQPEIRYRAMVGIAGLEIRRGHAEEAGVWCDRVIAEANEEDFASPLARAYYVRSLVSARLGEPTAAEESQKALAIYERIGDKIGAANALNNLGTQAFYTGRWDEAVEFHTGNLEARRAAGDVLGGALAGYNLGELYLEQGRFDEAKPLLERTLADFRGAGHLVGESATRLTLGRLATRSGEVTTATDLFAAALAIAHDADASDQIAEATLGKVELALAQGELSTASDELASLSDELSGPSLMRRHLYEAAVAFGAGRADDAGERLDLAQEEATRARAKHLEFAVVEMRGRLFGEDSAAADTMSEQLGLLARPLFRLGGAHAD